MLPQQSTPLRGAGADREAPTAEAVAAQPSLQQQLAEREAQLVELRAARDEAKAWPVELASLKTAYRSLQVQSSLAVKEVELALATAQADSTTQLRLLESERQAHAATSAALRAAGQAEAEQCARAEQFKRELQAIHRTLVGLVAQQAEARRNTETLSAQVRDREAKLGALNEAHATLSKGMELAQQRVLQLAQSLDESRGDAEGLQIQLADARLVCERQQAALTEAARSAVQAQAAHRQAIEQACDAAERERHAAQAVHEAHAQKLAAVAREQALRAAQIEAAQASQLAQLEAERAELLSRQITLRESLQSTRAAVAAQQRALEGALEAALAERVALGRELEATKSQMQQQARAELLELITQQSRAMSALDDARERRTRDWKLAFAADNAAANERLIDRLQKGEMQRAAARAEVEDGALRPLVPVPPSQEPAAVAPAAAAEVVESANPQDPENREPIAAPRSVPYVPTNLADSHATSTPHPEYPLLANAEPAQIEPPQPPQTEADARRGGLPPAPHSQLDCAIMNSPSTLEDLLVLPDKAFVDQLYRTLLGREPDPAGRLGHLDQLQRGVSKEALVAAFVQCPEGLAHAAPIEGLTELCERVEITQDGHMTGWASRITRPVVLEIRRRLAAMENRLAHQFHKLRPPIEQVPVLSDRVHQLALDVNRHGQDLGEIAARIAGVDQRIEGLDSRLAQLSQGLANLAGHFAALEQQGHKLEQRLADSEERQHTDLQQTQQRVLDAVERLELRLALNASHGDTEPPSKNSAQPSFKALDIRALQKVRQLLGGAEAGR